MEDPVFESIKTSLKGTTVLQTPRVSRETILSILGTHTDLIKMMRKDFSSMNDKVSRLEGEVITNRKQMTILADDMEMQKRSIETLFRLSSEFRTEMDELGKQVAELQSMKKLLSDQKEFVENLAVKFDSHSGEVNEFMNETSRNVSYLQTTVSDTTFKLSELQHYVDHFADNLVLSSSQITVDPAAGFASKAMNLTETLNMCNKNFNESEVRANEQGFVIEKILKELDTKAPDTVLFNINTLEKKVATIEMHLQKEEEQGIGAIRKACDELQVHVQTMQQELSEKIDRESVGFIVHEKYEEIVRYLQDALQSSLEDENNFKVKADEIQEMVIQLSNSKADRTEIANMQELMVKSEALLKKVGAQANVKERLKEFISKKEVDALLALKVDKSEFDFQLQNAAANNRRTRKASQQPGQMPVVDDAINKLPAIHPNNVNQSTPFMTDEVASDIIGNRVRLNNDSSTMHHSQSQKLPTPSGAIPVIAIGRSLSPPHSKQRATAGVQGDFGAMSKSHKGKSSKVSMSLPAATGPGAFRAASEAGQAGGWDKRAESPSEGGGGAAGGAAGADGYGRTEYPFVPPNYEMDYSQQAATTDHMAYLGAPVAGGGFNSKSQHLVHALPEGNSVPQADIEGEGMMLEGQDGKLYYQDLESP